MKLIDSWFMGTAAVIFATCAFAADPAVLVAQAAPPPPQSPQERVANLKAWLQASQGQLRHYEWIETTATAVDGEEKSRTQNTCYYSVDGQLQKVAVPSQGDEKSGGPPGILLPGKLLKKAGEHKKAELTEYMKNATALIHTYIPPDANRIQQAVNAGKMGMNMLEPGRRIQLAFKDYLKEGDQLSVDIELPTNRLLGMHVSSYLDDKKDAVTLDVTMGVLPDGTIHTAQSVLNAPAKKVKVTIDNSGYRHAAQ